jgi:hypothetical protein
MDHHGPPNPTAFAGHLLAGCRRVAWLMAAFWTCAAASAQEVAPPELAAEVRCVNSEVPAGLPAAAVQPPAPADVAPGGGCGNCPEAALGPLRDGPTVFGSCGCGQCGGCVPGQNPCYPCAANTRLGRFCCGIYEAICCPDPCYDPQWLAVADSAFFVEAARPVTQQRFRWDAGMNMVFPDRAEYFWARADGKGLGPSPQAPLLAARRVDYHELSMYTEAASGKFSFCVNVPYRSIPSVRTTGQGSARSTWGPRR